jgi:hypothetical protein
MRGPHKALQVVGAVLQSSLAYISVAGTVLMFLVFKLCRESCCSASAQQWEDEHLGEA